MKICRRALGWLLLCLLILPMYGQANLALPVRGLFVHSAYARASTPGISQDPTPVPGGDVTPVPGDGAPAAPNVGVSLRAIDVTAFPRIQGYLEVRDAQGAFIHGLTAEGVTVVEDGSPRPASKVEERRIGAQMVVAINPGPSFGIRNAQATSRYELVKDALRTWANNRVGSSIDDLSLLIAGGPAASHTSDPFQFITAINSDTVDPRNAPSNNLDVLARAVSLAGDPAPRDGMRRIVVFITSPPEGQIEGSLESLAAQAREGGISIYLWLVASSGAFSTQSAQQLIALSQGTGGQVFTFTGEEPLPSLETYLASLRDLYWIEYESAAASAGPHQVAVQVQAGEASIQSPVQTFEIDVQPPVPAFVAPPITIEHTVDPAAAAAAENMASEAPAQAPEAVASKSSDSDPAANSEAPDAALDSTRVLEVVFDFPDGRKRPLVYTALLVDGVVVDENTAPPFDRFSWDLSAITTAGVRRLQVQARDELGMTGSSPEHPVQVTVTQPSQSVVGGWQRSLPVISGLVALVAGAVLVLVLVVGGQLRPRALRAARHRRRLDPVTQPVHIHTEAPPARRTGWANRLQWPGRNSAPKADAYLNPLPDPENEDTLPPIPILTEEITFGSDASQATLVLDDPSVEPLHARLARQDDSTYRLADEGSIAGTWINYSPVSRDGARLEHGDLVHVGRIGFRFTLRKPAPSRKAVVIAEHDPTTAHSDNGNAGDAAEPAPEEQPAAVEPPVAVEPAPVREDPA